MCSAYQNKPGEMVLNFVTVLLRALLGHSAYPEPLVGEVFRRNGQPQLQAWKSSSVKVARQHPETRSQAEWWTGNQTSSFRKWCEWHFGNGGCTTDCLKSLPDCGHHDAVGRGYHFPLRYFHPVRAERSSGVMNHAVNRVHIFVRPQDGLGTAGGLLFSLALQKQ